MTDPLALPVPKVQRDWQDRPMVIPLGGKPGDPLVTLTRVTTYIGPVKDRWNIEQWGKRMIIFGAIERPDLLMLAAAHRDDTQEDKKVVNKIAKQLTEAGKASAKSNLGTALHKFIERINRGQQIGTVPQEYRADLNAYWYVVKCMKLIDIEVFLVHDGLGVGGTPDLIVLYKINGKYYIADVKTGSIDYPGEMAMQLAIYARCMRYNVLTGERTPLPPVSQTHGIIIHVPAGEGTAELIWLNIGETGDPQKPGGWDGVKLVPYIKAYRAAEKYMAKPFITAAPQSQVSA